MLAAIAAAGLIVVGALAVTAVTVTRHGPSSSTATTTVRGTAHGTVPLTVSTGVASWSLQAPVDSEVVLPALASPGAPAATSQLDVFGGSTTARKPANGVFALDVASGTLTQVADLTTALADAAGAVIAGGAVVFGGDTPSAVPTVQSLGGPASPSATSNGVPHTTVIATMPEPRAGAATAQIGNTTFVVGGANGAVPDPDVLATIDGRAYSVVASLRVPVAFPAVATVGRHLYVFGGEALTGPATGQPVDVVQLIDPVTHRVTVTGRLPQPLAGAAAVAVAGHIVLIGGDTLAPTPSTSPPGAPPVSAPAGGPSTPASSTSGAVWVFKPSTMKTSEVGRLQTPVSHAGVAVLGSVAWIVGGRAGGVPTSVVQTVTLTNSPPRG